MTLLANGADSRATDSDGNTPLHHAARSSDQVWRRCCAMPPPKSMR